MKNTLESASFVGKGDIFAPVSRQQCIIILTKQHLQHDLFARQQFCTEQREEQGHISRRGPVITSCPASSEVDKASFQASRVQPKSAHSCIDRIHTYYVQQHI